MCHRKALVGSSALLLAPLFALFSQVQAPGEDVVRTSPVRIGIVASAFRDTPEPMLNLMMAPLKSLLESQTGLTGKMTAGGDANNLAGQLAEDKVQLAIFHGFEFAWARQKYPELKPLLLAINPPACARAFVVVRKEGHVTKPSDLKDKTLALAMRTREHCRLFIERRCCPCGTEIKDFFAEITTPADPEEALDSVLTGKAQATVVDGTVLENYAERKPGCFAKLKILLESERFPWAVIACDPAHLDDAMQKRFCAGLIKATETRRGKQLLAICRIAGFRPIPKDYEKDLVQIIKAYPPPATEK